MPEEKAKRIGKWSYTDKDLRQKTYRANARLREIQLKFRAKEITRDEFWEQRQAISDELLKAQRFTI